MRHFPLRSKQGFTLIELMVAIAILGILMSVATPSFQSYVQVHQTGKLATTLFTDLRSLRQVAITQAQSVVICASSDQSTCAADAATPDNWAIGWIAFTDLNSNNQRDSDSEDIIILQTAITDGKISFNEGALLVFDFQGEVDSPSQFNICSHNNDATLNRAVIINNVGRAQFVSSEQLNGVIACS